MKLILQKVDFFFLTPFLIFTRCSDSCGGHFEFQVESIWNWSDVAEVEAEDILFSII